MSYSFKGIRKTLWSAKGDPHALLVAAKGQKYADYREQWARTQNFEVETEYPTQLDFELNPSCNMKCPMCTWSAVETFGEGRQSWMPFDAYKRILDEVGDRVLSVNLNHVNEPLIRKDIPDFVKYAVSKGVMEVMFNTNGMLLTEDMSRRLIAAGLTKLSVSIDAVTQATYDKVRVGGVFRQILDNIETFLRVRDEMDTALPLLKVTFLRLKINEDELPGFMETWRQKADLISIQNPVNPFDGSLGAERERELGLSRPADTDGKPGGAHVEIEYQKEPRRCPQPFQRMIVRADGTVHPCCNFRGVELVMGNVFESGVHAVWNSEGMRTLRELQKSGRYYENDVCRRCLENASEEAPDPDRVAVSVR
ncbi:MAG: radical SAM protein [Alphaproteobacteria bacterium]